MEVFRVQRLLDRWRDRMLFVVVASIALILRGNAQFVLLGLGLVTLGVTHGAVDHELDPSSRESKLFFFSIYCSGIVAFFALWWGKPGVALWIFIFYSAGHFGECQWKQTYARLPSTFTELALARIWGLFAAIFAPAYHLDQALPILRLILRDPHLNLSFSIRDAQLFSFALAGAAVISILVFEARRQRPKTIALGSTLLLTFVLVFLPLISGFLCFFCFWHSWDSIRHQMTARAWSPWEYAKRAIPFTVCSWLGLFVFVMGLRFELNPAGFWAGLFITLGALTVSHSQTMRRFYEALQSQVENKKPSLP